MNSLTITPLDKPITAEITLPGSLTYTIRALTLAALTNGPVKIVNALKSADTQAMFAALQTLGIKAEENNDGFIIYGDITDVKNKEFIMDIKLSGRSARMLMALLCIVPGIKILTCSTEFKKRPMKDLVDGLRQLGAEIEYREQDGALPVKILSNKLNPGTVEMNGHISSQYFSAIMMVAPLIGNVTIKVIGEQASQPFIDTTIHIMKEFGVKVINDNYKQYTIQSGQKYNNPTEYLVETDATAASYFWGIAAITKSKIKILHLSPNSKQGDVRFADILEQMGCKVTKNLKADWIEIEGPNMLHSVNVNMNTMPDVVPTLAVIAAFAKGKTELTGLSHLKGKESDRIEAPKTELEKMGVKTQTSDNSSTIFGTSPHGAFIETHGDHRIAMAFAIAGAKISGMQIINPEVVNKSFPNFWNKLKEIGISYNL